MFEPAVDGLGWFVAGAAPVEVCQHVGGTLLQRPEQAAAVCRVRRAE
jgi:hypothetical protein